ncbi:MAG: acyl carrier protein [Pseudomonadales bacterium]
MHSSDHLINFIVEQLLDHEQKIVADDELLVSGLLDSLAIVQLVEFIEGKFKVSVPPEDLRVENFASVNTIVEYLNQKPN